MHLLLDLRPHEAARIIVADGTSYAATKQTHLYYHKIEIASSIKERMNAVLNYEF
jgi:hypothetical protein